MKKYKPKLRNNIKKITILYSSRVKVMKSIDRPNTLKVTKEKQQLNIM